ncbi:MAG: hypothetical protein RMA76_43770 [Deltaproteobacteria bacterium]|jgi:hypothetical protein
MKRHHGQRGFALVTIVLLMSLATVSALVLLDVIETDRDIEAHERRAREARITAEGGLMEFMNDLDVLTLMPSPTDTEMKSSYQAASDSHFGREDSPYGSLQYQADIQLVRIAPMLESSHNSVRAVIYEVTVESTIDGRVGAGVEAEVFKIASSKIGVIQPRMHGR